MVNTNKILTVSYGTFSCTLEGFDDSFGTMKAIAEYFRDLASDDRYFGAEPPTPDAEMLARIAEREIARRVEARFEDDNKVVLRADQGTVLPVAARVATDTTNTTENDSAVQAKMAEPAPEPTPEPTPADSAALAEMAALGMDETIAANAVADSHIIVEDAEDAEAETTETADPIGVAVDMVEDAENVAEDDSDAAEAHDLSALLADQETDKQEQETDKQESGQQEAGDIHAADTVESTATDVDLENDEGDVDEGGHIPDAPHDAAADTDLDSVAAKLQRIRAVVNQSSEDAPAVSTYSEDEHADDFLSRTQEDLRTELEADAAADLIAEDHDDDSGEDEIAALLDRYNADHDDADDAHYADATAQAHADAATQDMAEDYDEAYEDEDEAAADVQPLRAVRVVKMKRDEFDAAIAASDLVEEIAETDQPEEASGGFTASQPDTSLSPDDEADLLRELASVEAELKARDAEDAVQSVADKAEEPAADAAENMTDEDEWPEDDNADSIFAEADDHPDAVTRGSARFNAADADSEMGRIFEETKAQLNEESGKGRRNAIAHLRAAVAATKAEQIAGGDLGEGGPDSEVYRDDLASVVRPRRPDADGTTTARTPRPETTRPAPLQLVAEQRVDVETAESHEPVRPRRVNTPVIEPMDDAAQGGFAEFADSVGANSLPELLEAAASYLAFVEGREQFSRPQLMTRVRQVEQDDFSREDGLRSFGQLLREGKIVKIKGGRFAASENISFRPNARYAGE